MTDKTISDFLDLLASKSHTPGGGSVAALCASCSAALVSMVSNLTIGKKAYIPVEEEIKSVLEQSEKLRKTLTELIIKDIQAFNTVMSAISMPKDTEENISLRFCELENSLREATIVPLEIMEHSVKVMELADIVAQKGSKHAVSDAGCAASIARSSVYSAYLNVLINLSQMTDQDFLKEVSQRAEVSLKRATELETIILTTVTKRILPNLNTAVNQ